VVFRLRFQSRSSVSVLRTLFFCLGTFVLAPTPCWSSVSSPRESLVSAQALHAEGQYFQAARYGFDALSGKGASDSEAYSWITLGLMDAGFHHSAAYFFIRTLQTGHAPAVKRVLARTNQIQAHVGPDLIRRYLVRHTKPSDYDDSNRSAYLYALGKAALLQGNLDQAIQSASGVSKDTPHWPYALQLKATANAISGRHKQALEDFQLCAEQAEGSIRSLTKVAEGVSERWIENRKKEMEDLRNRCLASVARVHYEAGRFDEADRQYDRIPKGSFVWADVLFEHAWNEYARKSYNRTLGKLVTYNSPHLSFFFNSEVDVLRAQTYLALCLYDDANEVINGFNAKYSRVENEVRGFLVRNERNLEAFYGLGKQALQAPIHHQRDVVRLLNRFVRAPYFQRLTTSEEELIAERIAIQQMTSRQSNLSSRADEGFPGFLQMILRWRLKTVRELGGAFVKNSLLDHHGILIADFDKVSFIKLEMLGRAKTSLLKPQEEASRRSRGRVIPRRRQDQLRWNFNGEFWSDEIGDYVFALESQCS
jgi:tetratricopeptide (TPR) repeat protein